MWDLDGRHYFDLCCSHGATLLGHGDERITRAVHQAIASGAGAYYSGDGLDYGRQGFDVWDLTREVLKAFPAGN